MAEMILKATGSKLQIISAIHVTSTQAQYDTCLFEFDEAWDGYGVRTAVFYSNPNNIKAMLLDGDNKCYIPWDSFGNSRYLYIGVYGNNGESYLPTQFVEVMYQPGANVDDHLYPPTPGIYEQFVSRLTDIDNLTTQLAQTADDLKQREINVKQPPFNVKGDGVTDDYEAIQSAISYLESVGGGTLFFPYTESKYITGGIIKISSNINLRGENTKIYTETAGIIFRILSSEYVSIDGFILESALNKEGTGYYEGALQSNVVGIKCANSKHITISNVQCYNMDWGLKFDSGGIEGALNEFITVSNIHTEEVWDPLYVSHTHFMNCDNLYLQAKSGQPGFLHPIYVNGNVFDLTITKLVCTESSGVGVGFKKEDAESIGNKNIILKDVKIENCTTAFSFYHTDNVIVDGFVVDNVGRLLGPNNSTNVTIRNGIATNVLTRLFHPVESENVVLENIYVDMSNVEGSDLILANECKNVKLINVTLDKIPAGKRIIYAGTTSVFQQLEFINSKFVFDKTSTIPIRILSESDAMFDNCQFLNLGVISSNLCYNEAGNILVKNCTLDGINNVSTLADDVTLKLNNWHKTNKALLES